MSEEPVRITTHEELENYLLSRGMAIEPDGSWFFPESMGKINIHVDLSPPPPTTGKLKNRKGGR